MEKSNRKRAVHIYTCAAFLAALLVLRFLAQSTLQLHFTYDSFQYLQYGLLEALHQIDETRMPLYGTLAKVLYRIFGTWAETLRGVTAVQMLLSFVGALLLGKACCMATGSRFISGLTMAAYMLNPSVFIWDTAILTEAFALCGTCLHLYLLVRWLKRKTVLTGCAAVAVCIGMIALRPSSAVFLGILLAFFILQMLFSGKLCRDQGVSAVRAILVPLGCAVLSVVLVCLYALAFFRCYHVFSLSNTLLRQQVYNDIRFDLYSNNEDTEVVEYIDEMLEQYPDDYWTAMSYARMTYGDTRIRQFHASCIRNNRAEYLASLMQLVQESLRDPFEARHTERGDAAYYGTAIAAETLGTDGDVMPHPYPGAAAAVRKV